MLFLEVPPFDVLTGQDAPYIGFGETFVIDPKSSSNYVQTVNEATRRMNGVFGIEVQHGMECFRLVDGAIDQMWSDGWNPDEGNGTLFTTDFGSVVIEGLRSDLGGSLVLRSDTDLSHASLWWKDKSVEAFPFHAVYKRLTSIEGESLTHFAISLKSLIGPN